MTDYERIVDEATAAGLELEHVGGGYVQAAAGNWRFKSYGGLWSAVPILGWGMPLAHAVYLHHIELPGGAWGLRSIAGQLIRVGGSAGAPHPHDWGQETVERYHIDTVAGLRIFADYVRRPGLTEAVIQSVCPYRTGDEEKQP